MIIDTSLLEPCVPYSYSVARVHYELWSLFLTHVLPKLEADMSSNKEFIRYAERIKSEKLDLCSHVVEEPNHKLPPELFCL